MQNLPFETRKIHPDGCKLILNDEATVAGLEERLGVILPADYRAFLKQYGAVYLRNVLVVPAVRDDERIGWEESVGGMSFYGIYNIPSGQRCPSDLVTIAVDHGADLPKGMIAFAAFGSDEFCISCTPESFGRVYLYGEQFDDDMPEDYLFLQAASFTAFLQSLRTMTDQEAEEWYQIRGG